MLAVFLAVIVLVAGQGTSTQVFPFSGGLPHCSNCGNVSEYACSSGIGNWNNGQFTFQDPIPSGQYALEITVIFMGAYGCETGSQTNMSATIEGTPVGVVIATSSGELCNCNACDGESSFCRRNHYQGFPSYNYGGSNTFQIVVGPDACCLHTATVSIVYGPLTPMPADTIYLDLEPTTQSGGQYTTGMGLCLSITENSFQSMFNFTFQDPVPSGSVVIQLQFNFYGGLFAAQNSQSGDWDKYLYTVAMGTVRGQYQEANATATSTWDNLTCEPLAHASLTYQVGWPGYSYGGQNSVAVINEGSGEFLDQTVCVTRGEVLLTYYTPGSDDVQRAIAA